MPSENNNLNRLWQALVSAVISADAKRALRLKRYFAATAVYAFCTLTTVLAWRWNLVEPATAQILVAAMALGALIFYGAIRSGLSSHLSDPALTLAQAIFAIVLIGLACGLVPQIRGALTMMMAVTLVFGAFVLSPRDCRLMSWFSFLALGLATLHTASDWRQVDQLRTLLIDFLMTSAALLAIGMLSGELSALKGLQQSQKSTLKKALGRLGQLANRDDLTGLPNRRLILELLAKEVAQAQRRQTPFCIALLDLDHFKRINDTQGHPAGDKALRRFASILAPSLRTGDVLARWGGEEFILLLPDALAEDATRVIERLRERCNNPVHWTDRPELRLTFSAGLSAHLPGEPSQSVIARADKALYRAKTNGRDRLEIE